MAQIIAGMASSHALALMDPDSWDDRRRMTRGRFQKVYGYEPAEQPEVAEQSPEFSKTHYANIERGLQDLKARLAELKPDALILIGDDQNENYRQDNLPQFAIFTGERVTTVDHESGQKREFVCAADLARDVLERSVESGVDMASSATFPDGRLRSHAHAQVLNYMDVQVPVVLVFVNAINVPAATPARCYEVGQRLRQAVEQSGAAGRVVLYASGGLSHFTSGYPWPHYKGPHTLGSICRDFDGRLVGLMREGRSSEVAKLSSLDLIENGDIEFRQWIVLLGALGSERPAWLEYEPLFRGLIGMAVGYWPLESQRTLAGAR